LLLKTNLMPTRSNTSTFAGGVAVATPAPVGATANATAIPGRFWAKFFALVGGRRTHDDANKAAKTANKVLALRDADAEGASQPMAVPPSKPVGRVHPTIVQSYTSVCDTLDIGAPLDPLADQVIPSMIPSIGDGGTSGLILALGGPSIINAYPEDKVIAETTSMVKCFLSTSNEDPQHWLDPRAWDGLDRVIPDLHAVLDPDRNLTNLVVAIMASIDGPTDSPGRLQALCQFRDENEIHFPGMTVAQLLGLVSDFRFIAVPLARPSPALSTASFFNHSNFAESNPSSKRKGPEDSFGGGGAGAAKRRAPPPEEPA
jgi:hypothetical protein